MWKTGKNLTTILTFRSDSFCNLFWQLRLDTISAALNLFRRNLISVQVRRFSALSACALENLTNWSHPYQATGESERNISTQVQYCRGIDIEYEKPMPQALRIEEICGWWLGGGAIWASRQPQWKGFNVFAGRQSSTSQSWLSHRRHCTCDDGGDGDDDCDGDDHCDGDDNCDGEAFKEGRWLMVIHAPAIALS